MENSFQDRLGQALALKKMAGQLKGFGGRKSARATGCPHWEVKYREITLTSRKGVEFKVFMGDLVKPAHEEGCFHPAILGGPGGGARSLEQPLVRPLLDILNGGGSAFQNYKRVIQPGVRIQCEATVKRRGGMDGGQQCSKRSELNAKRCKIHGGVPGSPKASSGLLVALSPQEAPKLLCDR